MDCSVIAKRGRRAKSPACSLQMDINHETDYEALLRLDPKWISDSHAPDGMMASGWRLVRTGGRIKAFGGMFQHEDLIPFIGKRVFVDGSDYWRSEFSVWKSCRRSGKLAEFFICHIDTSRDSTEKKREGGKK